MRRASITDIAMVKREDGERMFIRATSASLAIPYGIATQSPGRFDDQFLSQDDDRVKRVGSSVANDIEFEALARRPFRQSFVEGQPRAQQ